MPSCATGRTRNLFFISSQGLLQCTSWPECRFPMSFDSGDVGGCKTTKTSWKGPRKSRCTREHHPDQMFFPRQQILQTSLCLRRPKVLDCITRQKMVSGGPAEQRRGSYNINPALAYMFLGCFPTRYTYSHGSIHQYPLH